ncbi:MAG TPA: DinB family protein [Gemmatimonadaceae bacterium]|nr:DinB family protein [Gemmatimonadaceae bacterium]
MTDSRTPAAPQQEVWLRGPLAGFDPVVLPAAQALMQSAEDITRAAEPLNVAELWTSPGGAASVGFHLTHIAGSIDRLLTYARGEPLDETQRRALAAEKHAGTPPVDAATLVANATGAMQRAVQALRDTPRTELFAPRGVGRAQLPSTVWGLLFHIAEHTQRHTGQVITTAKIVRG